MRKLLKFGKKALSMTLVFMMLFLMMAGFAPMESHAAESGEYVRVLEDGKTIEYGVDGEYTKVCAIITENPKDDYTGVYDAQEYVILSRLIRGVYELNLETTSCELERPRIESNGCYVSIYSVEQNMDNGICELNLLATSKEVVNFEAPEYMEPFKDSDNIYNYPISYLKYAIYMYGEIVPTTGFIDTVTEVPVGAKVYNDLEDEYNFFIDSKEFHETGDGPYTEIVVEPGEAVALERIYTFGEYQVGTNLGWCLYEDGYNVCFFSPVAAEDIIPDGEELDVEQLRVDAVKKLIEELLEELVATNETDLEALIKEALLAAGVPAEVEVTCKITKTNATDIKDGSIEGTIEITCGSKSATVTVDETIEKTPHEHSYIWVVTKEATESEEGEMKGKCACGEEQIKAIPTLATSGDITVEADDENAYDGTVENSDEVKGQVPLTDEEQQAIFAGEDLKITLEVIDITEDSDANAEDKAIVQNNLGNNELAAYIDITLYKQIGDEEKVAVPNTNGAVKIVIVVPEEYRNNDKSITRTYSIIRVHNGEAKVIEALYNPDDFTLTFETDAFSTYALAYADVAAAPDTGETVTTGTWVLFVLSTLGVVVLRKRKF